MIKDKISTIVNNLNLNIASFKINLHAIEGFSILIIENKYAKIALMP